VLHREPNSFVQPSAVAAEVGAKVDRHSGQPGANTSSIERVAGFKRTCHGLGHNVLRVRLGKRTVARDPQ
jgi:hypothetical protein